jgi:hypothetical protein
MRLQGVTRTPKSILVERLDMAKITLFEFNPQGNIQIGPGSEGEGGLLDLPMGESEQTEMESAEQEDGGGGIAKIVVPLVALVAIAAVARYLTGGEDEEALEEESEGRLQQYTTTTE